MNPLSKIVTTLIIMNIFVYLGVNFSISIDTNREYNKDYHFHFEGDILDSFMAGHENYSQMVDDYKSNWTNYNYAFDEGVVQVPSKEAGGIISTLTQGTGFALDALKIVWTFILTIANVAMSPLTLFFNFSMPIYIGMMIGISYFVVFIMAFFSFIRGV